MSNKKPGFTGKTLEDALQEEADDIERRALAHAPEHRLSREEKDAMLKNILDRVKEKESAEEETSSGSEDKKEEKSKIKEFSGSAKKKPLRNRVAKCACIVLVAGCAVFASSLISEGNRMYWVQVWHNLFPGSSTAVTNNDENRVLSDVTEQEAREEVEEVLQIPVPRFYYLPDEMKFENVCIDLSMQYARFQYICSEGAVYLSISGTGADRTESWAPDSSEIDIISIKVADGEIPIYVIEDTTGKQGTVIYRAQWIYRNCQYELSGMMKKEEMIKILEKIRYTM
ncbi:MAG TPA: DUF4367 domain-containing protein [Candidatus Scatomonas merdavium]|nr:DUF4367 domain-containing protein [Candidatus Scatomonas merdavium]